MVKERTVRTRRTTRTPRTNVRDGDTEARILDAAHRVFVRSGTAGARTQEIAKEAGVNSALLHYYFRTKERLAEAVFRRAAGQLMPAVIGILASDLALEDKIAQVIDVELRQLTATPYLPGYILSELNHHPERAAQLISNATGITPEQVRACVLSVLRAQIDEAARAGRIRPIEPQQLVVNLLALCIFPFAARPMLTAVLGLDQAAFTKFID